MEFSVLICCKVRQQNLSPWRLQRIAQTRRWCFPTLAMRITCKKMCGPGRSAEERSRVPVNAPSIAKNPYLTRDQTFPGAIQTITDFQHKLGRRQQQKLVRPALKELTRHKQCDVMRKELQEPTTFPWLKLATSYWFADSADHSMFVPRDG